MSDTGAHSTRATVPTWFLPGLLAITLLAGGIRAPLLGFAADSFRLTEAMSLEEAENVRISSGMLHKGSLNPHAFEYPSFFYYLSLGEERALSALGAPRWSAFLVAARSTSLLFGLATIVLCGLLALRLGGPISGLLAAALVAFDRTSMETSALAKPNSAQVFFVLAGLGALVALVARPRLRAALLAAGCFALAAASKWLGLLGLPALAFAGALAAPGPTVPGLRGIALRVQAALFRPVSPWLVLAPLLVFGAVFLVCVPFSLLSPREFGMGFAQVFLAQGAHRRPLPWWVSLQYLERSLGPIGFALVAIGILWALLRLARWDGSPRASGLAVLTAWTLGYGGLVLFAFARLPSYVDLLVPPLAILAGCALAGTDGLVRRGGVAFAVCALALVGGAVANGAMGATRTAALPGDTRFAAGQWLGAHAADSDSVLADQGAYVPDRLRSVHWNAWGGPDRIVYDETRTWGQDRAWPEWYGGHRQLVFRNAKWAAPESILVAWRPRWVVTTSEWEQNRRNPPSANDWASPGYDQALADGSAGYVERARFAAASGPVVTVYERAVPVR